MHPMLTTAVKAARRAGSVINRGARDLDLLTVTTKGPKDFVSEVDHAAEAAIVETQRSHPDGLGHYNMIAGGFAGGASLGMNRQFWGYSVLPMLPDLDARVPENRALYWHDVLPDAISMYKRDGRLSLGVGDTGFGEEGIRRSQLGIRHAVNMLCARCIGTGFPYRHGEHLDAYMRMMRTMTIEAAGIRRPGAAALDLAYVAAGYYDGFWEVGLNPWDVAAGSLLILEAGGLVGDLAGDAEYLYGGQIIAAFLLISDAAVDGLTPWCGQPNISARAPGYEGSAGSRWRPHRCRCRAGPERWDRPECELPAATGRRSRPRRRHRWRRAFRAAGLRHSG